MNNQPIKVKRYYILRGVGYLYKVFAVLSVLIALGGIGFILIHFVGLPDSERLRPGSWNILWQQIIGSLVVGFLFALLFGTLGQLIDVMLSTNEHTRIMAEMVQRQTKILQAMQRDTTRENRINIPTE